ncbi:hypothetical protein [Bradyrhizobium sp. Ash2021]|uniref:hypothetical protein n=1 Tax=Bradyrhizobium sp. Ash2021 TaxID=2954771 RepID=UPI002815289E|nr:hypothetical protein [Bradyrhizobium sp. Ash2021]WMT72768.1 DUF3102 domain-containing protein [Bradyrhizobium sp. Ash2021]
MSRTAQNIVEIGRDLIALKERVDHGGFLPWVESQFGMIRPSSTRSPLLSLSQTYWLAVDRESGDADL